MYLLCDGVAGDIGPQRSACSNSSARLDLYVVAEGNGCLVCLPTKQESQICLTSSISGRPSTISFVAMFLMVLKLMCPSLACYLHGSSLIFVCRHTGLPTLRDTLYNLFGARNTFVKSFPLGSRIVR